MTKIQLTTSAIAALSFVLLLTQSGLINNASFAQTPNATNQTTAKTTGQPETTVLNKTTIPAQQTTVTVNQTIEPAITNQTLQPLENLTNQTQAPPSLSGIQNKTMVTPTGNATTTVVYKTTVPFNQTMVTDGSNQLQEQQQQQQTSNATTSTPTPPPPTGNTSGGVQGNQSQQQGSNNPLSKIPILGELFGGK
jgi:Na+/melibiose symporter-like transporter